MVKGLRLILPILLALGAYCAQADNLDIENLSLTDLLNIETSIAGKKALTPRESPGIISIVSREQIVDSGARDLLEVLQLLVPGLTPTTEVEGQVGLSIRGVWASDSRVLLMMDGVELNEEIFGAIVTGNHYPAELIERVEVIRGPGSVMYGGYAAMGVINVITRGASLPDGYIFSGRAAQMTESPSHQNLTLAMGRKQGELAYDLMMSVGDGYRGEGVTSSVPDYGNNSGDITNQNRLQPEIYNLGVSYAGLEFRGVVDRYRTQYINPGWAQIYSEPIVETFDSYNAQLRYTHKVSDTLRIVPTYLYRYVEPWRVRLLADPWEFAKVSEKHKLSLNAEWDASDNVDVIAGVEYSELEVRAHELTRVNGAVIDSDAAAGKLPVQTKSISVYAESTVKTEVGNFVVGGRYESPDQYDSAFVPRLGWSRAWERMHSKIMLSQSYRAPSGIMAARSASNVKLKPELLTNIELETGYRLTEQTWLVANIFDIKMQDALIYQAATTGEFANKGTIGTRGAEAEFLYLGARFNANVGLAYYQREDTTVASFNAPDDEGLHIGVPAYRVNALMGYKISRNFGVHPSLMYYGERYALNTEAEPEKFDPTLVANLNFKYQNFLLQGLTATAGVMNVGDADLPFLQGYDNEVAAVPSNRRAYNLMLSYQSSF